MEQNTINIKRSACSALSSFSNGDVAIGFLDKANFLICQKRKYDSTKIEHYRFKCIDFSEKLKVSSICITNDDILYISFCNYDKILKYRYSVNDYNKNNYIDDKEIIQLDKKYLNSTIVELNNEIYIGFEKTNIIEKITNNNRIKINISGINNIKMISRGLNDTIFVVAENIDTFIILNNNEQKIIKTDFKKHCSNVFKCKNNTLVLGFTLSNFFVIFKDNEFKTIELPWCCTCNSITEGFNGELYFTFTECYYNRFIFAVFNNKIEPIILDYEKRYGVLTTNSQGKIYLGSRDYDKLQIFHPEYTLLDDIDIKLEKCKL